MMRENGLDYEKWMRRGFELGEEERSVVIRDGVVGSGEFEGRRSMGCDDKNVQGYRSVGGYEKGHKLNPSLSSFQHLIDSGLNSNVNNEHANNNEKSSIAR